MQDLLLLRDSRASLANRALEWAMRLAGGASAVAFDADGGVLAARGLRPADVSQIKRAIVPLRPGVNRIELDDKDTALLLLHISGLSEGGRLAGLAGPLPPGFGTDGISRRQQFMSDVEHALDRARLPVQLEAAEAQLSQA